MRCAVNSFASLLMSKPALFRVLTALAVLSMTATGGNVYAQSPAAATTTQSFSILEYRVLGNTVLDVRSVEKAVTPFLGPNRSFTDVEGARAALEAAYHDHGFGTVFVDIPEQTVDDGIVRLRATEGRLHAATVSGAQYYSERQIKNAIPAASTGTVPDLNALQTQIGAVNAQAPDRSITPVLKAGPTPGTVDLALTVDDHLPFHGSLELNNQYTPNTKPLRLVGYVSYDNLFGALHSLSMQYQSAPQATKEAGVFAAGYVAPLSTGKLSVTYIHSSSDVTTVSSLGVIGKGSIYGLHYDYPVTATPQLLEDLTLGLDYKHFAQDAGSVKSPIAYADLSLVYAGTWTTQPRTVTWSTGPSFSVRGVGSNAQDFANKCYLCRQNYFVFHADGSVTEHVNKGMDLVARLAAQYSATPLISNEQFLVGGAQTVRGYYEAESLGDRGVRGMIEARAPSLFSSPRFHAVPYAFLDAGDISYVAPLPGQPPSIFLASTGAGMTLDLWTHMVGNLTFAHALRTTSESQPANGNTAAALVPPHTRAGDNRWLFTIKGVW